MLEDRLSSPDLEDKEARWLGSLSREVGLGPCLQPGGGKGQLGLLGCVDSMAWHVRTTGI